MDVISLPGSSTMVLNKSASETAASKLRDVFNVDTFNRNIENFNNTISSSFANTFNKNNSDQMMENLRTAFTFKGTAPALPSSASFVSSLGSISTNSDAPPLMSPVPPGIEGSPGDPYDLTHVDPLPITLVDHSMDDNQENGKMWARSAWVGDYSIVAGAGKAGAYVSWLCVIETVESQSIRFRKRYSEFVSLQQLLLREFPHLRAAIPGLPPKSIISKFRPAFLEERRRGLEFFLSCIVLNPVFAGSQVVKDFISSSSLLPTS
ncbi:Phox homologous domain-containing protein [Myxozyma melibiosi]|uniref:Endosomal/vacuolar adapter protein YPT35 n=1 Tax=Myxozyma melibiosi TaxID=54550 RepID=A0ABR1FEF0_9ASCO